MLYALALVFGFTSVLIRCWQLQIQSEGLFEDKALKNQLRTFPIPAKRGKILDRRDKVLAGNRNAYRVKLLDPSLPVTHRQLELLGSILGGTTKELKIKIGRHRGEYFYPVLLREDIGRRSSTILLENKVYLPNIVIERAPVRYYPYETLACHIIGYMGRIAREELKSYEKKGYPRDALIGKSGLEKLREGLLRGRDGLKSVQVDALGWPHNERVNYPPSPGKDLRLTIDLEFQMAVERALEGQRGGVVLLDCSNGDILAMASYPNFDPNLFTRFIPGTEWKRLKDKRRTPLINRAIEGEYQPGSTFKLVTGYAALLNGVVEPQTSIRCNGSFQLGRRTAYCWKPGGHGRVQFNRALGQSCNVYFYNIGAEINVNDLALAARDMGLGHKTDVSLMNERPGIIPDKHWRERRKEKQNAPWTRGDTVNAVIGQGDMLVTPLQMARAIAAVSNGGKIFRPRIVEAVLDEEGSIVENIEVELERDMNISPDVLEPLREGLRMAVDSGTAWRARIKEVTVFGKTGSAQNPGRKTHAWFIGVMESRHPSVAISVLLEGAGAGGTCAVPVAKEAFKRIKEIIDLRRPIPPKNSLIAKTRVSENSTEKPAEETTSQDSAVTTTSTSASLQIRVGQGNSDTAYIMGIDPDETMEYSTGDDNLYIEQ